MTLFLSHCMYEKKRNKPHDKEEETLVAFSAQLPKLRADFEPPSRFWWGERKLQWKGLVGCCLLAVWLRKHDLTSLSLVLSFVTCCGMTHTAVSFLWEWEMANAKCLAQKSATNGGLIVVTDNYSFCPLRTCVWLMMPSRGSMTLFLGPWAWKKSSALLFLDYSRGSSWAIEGMAEQVQALPLIN